MTPLIWTSNPIESWMANRRGAKAAVRDADEARADGRARRLNPLVTTLTTSMTTSKMTMRCPLSSTMTNMMKFIVGLHEAVALKRRRDLEVKIG
jgi:hypothetical protein